MADAKLSAASPPCARPPTPHGQSGLRKTQRPGPTPPHNHDFAHLPPREAAIAAYIDRLPGGADISVKTLAKTLPYGQCALRTALNNLQRAGHLRRGREHLADSGSPRWITRTWFSRTARDDDWWAAFTRGDVPKESPEPPPGGPTRSRAYILLAALGRTTPALSLSEAACAELAPLLTEWFARGATDEHVLQSLTGGPPDPGPPPGRPHPQPPDDEAPTGTRA